MNKILKKYLDTYFPNSEERQKVLNRYGEASLTKIAKSLYEYQSEVDSFRAEAAKKIEELKEILYSNYVNSIKAGLPQDQLTPLPKFMRDYVPKQKIDITGITLRYEDDDQKFRNNEAAASELQKALIKKKETTFK